MGRAQGPPGRRGPPRSCAARSSRRSRPPSGASLRATTRATARSSGRQRVFPARRWRPMAMPDLRGPAPHRPGRPLARSVARRRRRPARRLLRRGGLARLHHHPAAHRPGVSPPATLPPSRCSRARSSPRPPRAPRSRSSRRGPSPPPARALAADLRGGPRAPHPQCVGGLDVPGATTATSRRASPKRRASRRSSPRPASPSRAAVRQAMGSAIAVAAMSPAVLALALLPGFPPTPGAPHGR